MRRNLLIILEFGNSLALQRTFSLRFTTIVCYYDLIYHAYSRFPFPDIASTRFCFAVIRRTASNFLAHPSPCFLSRSRVAGQSVKSSNRKGQSYRRVILVSALFPQLDASCPPVPIFPFFFFSLRKKDPSQDYHYQSQSSASKPKPTRRLVH